MSISNHKYVDMPIDRAILRIASYINHQNDIEAVDISTKSNFSIYCQGFNFMAPVELDQLVAMKELIEKAIQQRKEVDAALDELPVSEVAA